MKELFDEVSSNCSKLVTKKYSTSFSLAVKMLSPKIRTAIYNIYGFVRFADEIVDSFHQYDKEKLINKFEADYYDALEDGISLNPILNAFQQTVFQYHISDNLVQSFLKSMKADLYKTAYKTKEEYDSYIYGSADVVGLMCLKVFVNGDSEKYEELKKPAMRLGSAFQKVNFLRDLKDDIEGLHRSYFPNVDFKTLERNIYISKNKGLVWFDELLNTWMGTCRGSGVIEKNQNQWKIKHYVLSVSIPNESINKVIKVKREIDSIFLQKFK